ncbi:unnamed protein product [Callosobruchus maculatus]|uniref:Calpain catalytic domain-containing protein n=1 Tax=Callosobruchus maculatus TaxID=64391 RepID=A0A653BG67_CALMS|nr:unnamed protein product [Callosobruchus maculatus]
MEEKKSPETELFKIICKDYPSEFVLDKNVAKDYFRQFGKLKRVTFRPKLRICTVEYANKESCMNALSLGGEYKGTKFEVMQNISPDAKKKPEKSEAPIWVDKDEIEAELEAMMGLTPKSHLTEVVSTSSELPKAKKSPKLKRSWKPETVEKMPDKSKKKIKTLLEKPDKTRPLKSKPVPIVKTPIRTSSLSPEQVDLVNVILSQAITAEDKYRVLDARDKLIRAKLKRKRVSVKSKATLGTCQDMCPEKERLMRETRHQVALYEQMDESNSMDIRKAVKQYSRSSADQETPLPHELRPVSVLQMTMCYLMHNIVDLCDTDDQELCCQGAVELVEQCARFHIHCSARLVAEEPSVCDQKINTENLTKCLQTLKYMYHDLQLKGEQCPNEAEFRAYVILLNLNNANFMWELQQLRPEIQKSTEVKFALDVYSAIDKNNYVKFFKLVYSTTYLNACILMRYFVQVRTTAMRTILKCYSPRASKSVFPLEELIRILAFDDADSAIDFLRSHGVAVNQEKSHIIVEKTTFQLPEFPYILDRSLNVVESKRTQSVGRVICGKDLPPKSYEDHTPQNSFDRKGYLVYKDILEERDLEEAKSKLLADLAADSFESEKAEKPAREQEYKGSTTPTPARIVQQKPTTSVTPRHRPELHRGTSVHLQVSGQDTYSEEEKRVLLHTSRINKREYVPFMSVDLSEKFQYAIPFTDKDGPLPLVEKQRRDFYKFARPEELCSDPCIVAGQYPNYLSIKQTIISDCSFVASLAVSANYERKFGRKLVTAIIYPQTRDKKPLYNPFGKYMIKLHINGVARKVIIDDSLPIDRFGRLLCSYSSNKNEFWVSFLEKAYMKVMGGYDFPGSNSNIDLHALTGWIPERVAIRLKEPDFNKESLFNTLESRLEKGDVLVTVATGELSDYESERSGLVKLLKLKNPWSHLRWRGNYSELDTKHWTPELQRQLNYDPNSAAQFDNGVFWIDYDSVLRFFDVFYMNWNPELFKSSGAVWLLLTRHITEIDDFRENKEYINLFVYKVDPPPYIDGVKINSPHYLCKIILNPSSGRRYTVVVSQHEKSTTIYYTLRAYATCPFTLTKIVDPYRYEKQVTGQWEGVSAGGCPNHPMTYPYNPKYKLEIDSSSNNNQLLVELKGPKQYQMGFDITILKVNDETVTAPFRSRASGAYRTTLAPSLNFAIISCFFISNNIIPSAVPVFKLSTPLLNGIFNLKARNIDKKLANLNQTIF